MEALPKGLCYCFPQIERVGVEWTSECTNDRLGGAIKPGETALSALGSPAEPSLCADHFPMKMLGVSRNPSLSGSLSGLIAPGGPCFLDFRSPSVIVGRDGLGLTDVAV